MYGYESIPRDVSGNHPNSVMSIASVKTNASLFIRREWQCSSNDANWRTTADMHVPICRVQVQKHSRSLMKQIHKKFVESLSITCPCFKTNKYYSSVTICTLNHFHQILHDEKSNGFVACSFIFHTIYSHFISLKILYESDFR